MPSPAAPQVIDRLLSQPGLWRATSLERVTQKCVPSGFSALDAELPGGGWPIGALTELLLAHEGIGELRMLGRALAALSRNQQRLAWIAPPHQPFAPALAAAGIDLANLVIVRTACERDTLWASEQALSSGACGAVLSWLPDAGPSPSFTALRRLQLAAESGHALALVFRPPRAARESTPAALRLAVEAADGGLALRILKRRGPPLATPLRLSAFAEPYALDRGPPAQSSARRIPAQLAAV
jgi:hypothetical protein